MGIVFFVSIFATQTLTDGFSQYFSDSHFPQIHWTLLSLKSVVILSQFSNYPTLIFLFLQTISKAPNHDWYPCHPHILYFFSILLQGLGICQVCRVFFFCSVHKQQALFVDKLFPCNKKLLLFFFKNRVYLKYFLFFPIARLYTSSH